MRPSTRGETNVAWISKYCHMPSGGKLTMEEIDIVLRVYDQGADIVITGRLAAFITLLHLCGVEATQKDFRPKTQTDVFSVWGAAGRELREVLRRDGGAIRCLELQTEWRAA